MKNIVISVVIAMLLCFLALSFSYQFSNEPILAPNYAANAEDQPVITGNSILLKDISIYLGLTHEHQQSSQTLTSLPETLGPGVCLIDMNRDGYMDIIALGGSGHSRYYGQSSWWNKSKSIRVLLNDQGLGFVDITSESGMDEPLWTIACSVADFDNDTHQDLFVSGFKGNRLYKNNGDNTFSDVTESSGLVQGLWSTGASVADVNKDGLLDLYVTNFIHYKKGNVTFERAKGFRTSRNTAMEATLYDPQSNHLYINRGDFTFFEKTSEFGLNDDVGRTLSSNWFDINSDGWQDLIVVNKSGTTNRFYLNDKGKKFIPAVPPFTIFELSHTRDIAKADFDNNGRQDFFFSSRSAKPNILITNANCETEPNPKCKINPFSERARNLKLTSASELAMNGMGAHAADFNRDGYIDIFTANGQFSQHMDSPYISQGQANSLHLHSTQNGFTSIDTGQHIHSSRGAVSSDLNNDGNLEIIVANNNDQLKIYKLIQENKNNWISLDLSSTQPAVLAYESKVTIHSDKAVNTYTYKHPTSLFSSGDPRLHIGLGKATKINKIQIFWPDQTLSEFSDVEANQHYTITKASNTLESIQSTPKNATVAAIKTLDQNMMHNLVEALAFTDINNLSSAYLQSLWRELNADQKVSLLAKLNRNYGKATRTILNLGLNDSDSGTLIEAIKLAGRIEDEFSISPLISLISHKDKKIKCEAAKVFEHFFKQEEAVIRRKGLAIRPLITALEHDDTSTSCILRALAESESIDAAHPIISTLNSSKSKTTKISALLALGQIRDTRSVTSIETHALDPLNDAEIIAASIYSMENINSHNAQKLFDIAIDSTAAINEEKLIKQLSILIWLSKNSSSRLFTRSTLTAHANQLLENYRKIQRNTHPSLAFTVLNLIYLDIIKDKNKKIDELIYSANRSIQLHAAVAAITNNTSTRSDGESVLIDMLAYINTSADFDITNNSAIILSDTFIDSLIMEYNNKPEIHKQIFSLLKSMSKFNQIDFIQKTLDRSGKNKNKIKLINFYIQQKIYPKNYALATKLSSNSAVLTKFTEWYFHTNREGISKKELIAASLQIDKILRDENISKEDASKIVYLAAKHNQNIRYRVLGGKSTILQTLSAAEILSLQAIELALSPDKKNTLRKKQIEKVILNVNRNTSNRLLALKVYAQYDPDAVIPYTQKILE